MAKKDVACKLKYNYPAKGSLIKIFDALVDGGVHKDLICRVLSVEGKKVKVLIMNYNIPATNIYNYPDVYDNYQQVGNYNVLKYAGSNMDTALNQTLYNKMTTRMKKGILATNVTQHNYVLSSWYTPPSSGDDFLIKALHDLSSQATTYRYQGFKDVDIDINVGNRYIYLMDIKDIKDYFNPSKGGTIDGKNVNWLLYNAQDPTPDIINNNERWFMSACAGGEATEGNIEVADQVAE